jgi:copper chaperone CopZ
MKRFIIGAALLAAFPAVAIGAPREASSPRPAATAPAAVTTATIQVNGLVCDFCARSLEKVLGRKREVAAVAVDMDAQEVRLTFRPGRTLADEDLRRLVTDAGFATVAIRRGSA